MKIASWNVNSLNMRLDHVLSWLDQAKPDLLCLQETKCADAAFPRAAIEKIRVAGMLSWAEGI